MLSIRNSKMLCLTEGNYLLKTDNYNFISNITQFSWPCMLPTNNLKRTPRMCRAPTPKAGHLGDGRWGTKMQVSDTNQLLYRAPHRRCDIQI